MVKQLNAIDINKSFMQKDIISFVNSLNDEELDGIVINYWYNPIRGIAPYQADLKLGINYIKDKWNNFWEDYSSDPIELIDLIGRSEDDGFLKNN